MAWFWSKKAKDDDDEYEYYYSDEEEEYTSDEYVEDDDDKDYDGDGDYSERTDPRDDAASESMNDDEQEEGMPTAGHHANANEVAARETPMVAAEEAQHDEDEPDASSANDDSADEPINDDHHNVESAETTLDVPNADAVRQDEPRKDAQQHEVEESFHVSLDSHDQVEVQDSDGDDEDGTDEETIGKDNVEMQEEPVDDPTDNGNNAPDNSTISKKQPTKPSSSANNAAPEVEESDDRDDDSEQSKTSEWVDVQKEAAEVNQNGEVDQDVDDDDDDDEDEDEDETTLTEKQSMLILAAEHDRVDIVKSILSDDISNEDSAELLKPTMNIPPLHVAISFGSVNVTQSLLRMGADPSTRPNVEAIQEAQEQYQAMKSANETEFVQLSNMSRFDGVSAWELGFGRGDFERLLPKRGGWSLFGSPKKQEPLVESSNDGDGNNNNSKNDDASLPPLRPVEMPDTKRDGIKHAFTAEALRCVGGDEVHRLKQLLDSGMPSSIEIGGRSLVLWAKELGATQCQRYLNPSKSTQEGGDETAGAAEDASAGAYSDGIPAPSQQDPARESGIDDSGPNGKASDDKRQRIGTIKTTSAPEDTRKSPRRSHVENNFTDVQNLANRCDELESLAEALSVCLDNLAEEVSVCQSLLLQGGGSALAVHVKSLKSTKKNKMDELSAVTEDFEENEADLEDLLEEVDELGLDIDRFFPQDWSPRPGNKPSTRYNSLLAQISSLEEAKQREKLNEYIAASENKVRKLRSSIADLSEESAKDLEQVERRGLIGGINLVRSIREEIRDIEFQLSETKVWNSECQAKIDVIQARLEENYDFEQIGMDGGAFEAAEPSSREISYNEDNDTEQPVASAFRDRNAGTLPPAITDGSDHSRGKELSASSSGSSVVSPRTSPKRAPERIVIPGRILNPMHSPKSPMAKEKVAGKPGASAPLVDVDGADNAETATKQSPDDEGVNTESRALVIRNPNGNKGYLTFTLWKVILRLMGLDNDLIKLKNKQKDTMPTPKSLMIV
eukprot:CAMPEP_0119547478 /NCGR_PEP_ID=MMETSP1352-20130426/1594_1 /TAXON_ID=265584 /ORGANISM="Stauroneis constricta, Strain CCMP1120" /LENGTH=1014 /DNA_ID=CAMNT_0007592421 /DNA_START=57 /DNA_END=3101 /DNA_ORIENTATION=+